MSLAVFCVCVGCALLVGLLEGLLLPLRKKLPLPFTVFSDIGLGLLLVIPFGLTVFLLYDGRLSLYALPLCAAFFCIGTACGRKIVGAAAKKSNGNQREKTVGVTAKNSRAKKNKREKIAKPA